MCANDETFIGDGACRNVGILTVRKINLQSREADAVRTNQVCPWTGIDGRASRLVTAGYQSLVDVGETKQRVVFPSRRRQAHEVTTTSQ